MTKIVYPGTFDPITNGHVDLVKRSLKLFDKIIVAVAEDTQKNTLFSCAERVKMVNQVLKDLVNVEVLEFSGLLVDFVAKQNAQAVLRGLRAVSDFEYEFQLAGINRHLNPEVETIFLTPSNEYTFVASSTIKEAASLGGDVSEFVDPSVLEMLQKRF